MAAAHRLELRLARLWPDGLLALLRTRIGRQAANAVTVFFDIGYAARLSPVPPLSTDRLTDAIADFGSRDGPEQRSRDNLHMRDEPPTDTTAAPTTGAAPGIDTAREYGNRHTSLAG